MIKNIKIIFIFFLLFFLTTLKAKADNQVNLYFFYGQGCPHCSAEEKFLEKLQKEIPNLKIYSYEIWYNQKNAKFLQELAKNYQWNVQGVPLTIIGNKTFSGYLNDDSTGTAIKNTIEFCLNNPCNDLIKNFSTQKKENELKEKNFPNYETLFFKNINLEKLSLPFITLIIAALDGINPCALWTLLFLINFLLPLNDRKKIIIYGGTFIVVSAVFYFTILAAWLNILMFIGLFFWLKIIIGLIALWTGYKNIKENIVKEKSCKIIGEQKRKSIFEKIKIILNQKNSWLIILGIIFLAISINVFELLCSAGLPAIYTQILSMSNLYFWQYYIYLILYSFIFVLNQIILLIIAVYTMKLRAFNPKFIRWVNLIGGIIMIIIGFLLIFKTEWLMFE